MTDDTQNLVLEHWRAIRAKLDEHSNRLNGIEMQLSALGQSIAGLTTAVDGGGSDLQELRRRVERIERRLEWREDKT